MAISISLISIRVPTVLEFGAARIALVVVRSQQDGASADATGLFNAFALNLIVEVHHVRVVHTVPAAEVVVVVIRHNRNQYSSCTQNVKHSFVNQNETNIALIRAAISSVTDYTRRKSLIIKGLGRAP